MAAAAAGRTPWGKIGTVAVFTAFLAFPFYWMLITTFKQTVPF